MEFLIFIPQYGYLSPTQKCYIEGKATTEIKNL